MIKDPGQKESRQGVAALEDIKRSVSLLVGQCTPKAYAGATVVGAPGADATFSQSPVCKASMLEAGVARLAPITEVATAMLPQCVGSLTQGCDQDRAALTNGTVAPQAQTVANSERQPLLPSIIGNDQLRTSASPELHGFEIGAQPNTCDLATAGGFMRTRGLPSPTPADKLQQRQADDELSTTSSEDSEPNQDLEKCGAAQPEERFYYASAQGLDTPLGLKLAQDDSLVVDHVQAGGVAHQQGVEAGDRVIEINCVGTQGMTREQAMPLLKQRPMTVKLARRASST